MSSLPFLVCVGALLAGVGVRTLYAVPVVLSVWLLVLSIGLGLVWRRRSFASAACPVAMLGLACAFLALGIFRTELASWQFEHSGLETQVEQNITLTGVVVKEPNVKENNTTLYIQTETDRVLVSVDRLSSVRYGDKIEVEGTLTRPEVFATDLGRTFQYPGYLRARGVEYRVSFATVSVLEHDQANPVLATLLKTKQLFIHAIEQHIPEPQAGLSEGLLLGVKSALGEEIELDFRRAGIIHIVVLSGYNVMLVVSFIMYVFSFMLPIRARIVAGIVAIIAFALIVGLSATVVRASVMASLLLLAQAVGRRYDVMRALFFAGTMMILLNPYLLLYDIGFQLSFVATLGLLLIVPQFEERLLTGSRWQLFGMKEFFFATVATQIAVLPLLLYHIGEVSLVAVVVNMLVLPIVPLAMLLTFLVGLVGLLIPTVATLLAIPATWSLSYILFIAKWSAALPMATVVVPAFSVWVIGGLYGMLVVGYVWYQRRTQAVLTNGWVVEEEKETVGAANKAAPTVSEKTPIFFR